MSANQARIDAMEKTALAADADLPVRIWVEGDGQMYGEFHGNGRTRVAVSPYDAIKLIHKARVAVSRLISI